MNFHLEFIQCDDCLLKKLNKGDKKPNAVINHYIAIGYFIVFWDYI